MLAAASTNPILMQQVANVANPQATRQARRLYIGGVPLGVTEGEIGEFFFAAMRSAGIPCAQVTNPIIAVQLNVEKSFAFIEFRSPDDATSGMAFDGIVLRGTALKVRRPKDYQAPPTGDPAPQGSSVYIPGIVSTNVPDSPNKIFIGGLPMFLGEEQIKELLVSFGPLRAFNLVKDGQTGNSKGYAFFEYVDPGVTDLACQGLNGLNLQDKTLVVQRANTAARPAGSGGMDPIMAAMMGIGAPLAPTSTAAATKILQLLNMCTPEELLDDEEYADINEDVKEECGKFGPVASLFIPRPTSATDTPPGLGKIFVEFETVEGSVAAQQALYGRKFGPRTVVSSFYPEDLYQQRQF